MRYRLFNLLKLPNKLNVFFWGGDGHKLLLIRIGSRNEAEPRKCRRRILQSVNMWWWWWSLYFTIQYASVLEMVLLTGLPLHVWLTGGKATQYFRVHVLFPRTMKLLKSHFCPNIFFFKITCKDINKKLPNVYPPSIYFYSVGAEGLLYMGEAVLWGCGETHCFCSQSCRFETKALGAQIPLLSASRIKLERRQLTMDARQRHLGETSDLIRDWLLASFLICPRDPAYLRWFTTESSSRGLLIHSNAWWRQIQSHYWSRSRVSCGCGQLSSHFGWEANHPPPHPPLSSSTVWTAVSRGSSRG